MAKARKKRNFPLAPPADLIPVLSCMFLLIPALLLAMEVASFASVPVSPPLATATDAPPSNETEPFSFRVRVASDGFRITAGRRGLESAETTIAMAGEEHDFAELTKLAQQTKALYPTESTLTLTAEGDVPLSVLVETMDAARGPKCSLAEVHASSVPPPECFFWMVIVES